MGRAGQLLDSPGISMGNLELAIDYIENMSSYEPELTEVKSTLFDKEAEQVECKADKKKIEIDYDKIMKKFSLVEGETVDVAELIEKRDSASGCVDNELNGAELAYLINKTVARNSDATEDDAEQMTDADLGFGVEDSEETEGFDSGFEEAIEEDDEENEVSDSSLNEALEEYDTDSNYSGESSSNSDETSEDKSDEEVAEELFGFDDSSDENDVNGNEDDWCDNETEEANLLDNSYTDYNVEENIEEDSQKPKEFTLDELLGTHGDEDNSRSTQINKSVNTEKIEMDDLSDNEDEEEDDYRQELAKRRLERREKLEQRRREMAERAEMNRRNEMYDRYGSTKEHKYDYEEPSKSENRLTKELFVNGLHQNRVESKPVENEIDYSTLDSNTLKKVVKEYMISRGVRKSLLDINELESKFGKHIISKLVAEGFLLKTSKGVTIGI